jgi:uncharacterized membrane protein
VSVDVYRFMQMTSRFCALFLRRGPPKCVLLLPTVMADVESLLNRWQTAGVLDAETAGRIRAHEARQKKPAGLRWQVIVVLILGAILLACGVVLFVSADWSQIGPFARLAVVLAMVSVFHLGGGWTREHFHGLSTTLHAVGTISTGAAIVLVGQIFNIEEHWPTAVLLWALAALAGWMLLHDEVQEALTLLLFPAWIFSEFLYAANGHIGENVYAGRFEIVWGVLYLTVFLDSKRKFLRGALFALAAFVSVIGLFVLLAGWRSWSADQTFLPLGTRSWGWVIIAALPLCFAVFKLRKSLVPVAVAIVFTTVLPWCNRTWTETKGNFTFDRAEPNLAAHALVAAFAVFLIWWGVRLASRALVNLGIGWFAIAVAWFYFSNIMDKLDRSLGLIGLGILFLAGGWALEKTRRSLLAGMGQADVSGEEAK